MSQRHGLWKFGAACLAWAAGAPAALAQSGYVGDLPISAGAAATSPDLNNETGILTLTGAHVYRDVANAAGAAIVNQGQTTGEVTANAGVITNAPKATWTGDLDFGANVPGAQVVNEGSWDGSLHNAGGDLVNSGLATGIVNQSGNFVNDGTIATNLTNAGQTTNSGAILGAVDNAASLVNNAAGTIGGGLVNGGAATNDGTIAGGVTQSGRFVNNSGAILRGGLTNQAGSSVNNGDVFGGASVAAGEIVNNGKVAGGVAITGAAASFVNNAEVSGPVSVTSGSFVNNGAGTVAGVVTNAATLGNAGVIEGGLVNSGAFTNLSSGALYHGFTQTAGQTINDGAVYGGGVLKAGLGVNDGAISGDVSILGAGVLTNNGTIDGVIGNGGLFVNNASGIVEKRLDNTGTASNGGVLLGGVATSGAFVNNAAGQIAGGLSASGGSTSNAGVITGGVEVSGGVLTSTGEILGGLDNAGTVHATGVIGGAIVNSGALTIGEVATGATLTILPGSTVTGVVTIPVDLSTGKANLLQAHGVDLAGASVAFSGLFANAAKTYWGDLVYSDVAIALSASARATLAAASGPLYAYGSPDGVRIVQTVNPGLAATAAHHAAATLQALNATLLDGPADFLRSPSDPAPNLAAAHVWSRALGADLAFAGANYGGAGPAFGQAHIETRLAGGEFGLEQGLYNIENSGMSLHLGLVGGDVSASSSDRDLAGAAATTSAPFFGVYAGLAGNGFTGLVEARYNRLDMRLTDPTLGVANQPQSAAGMTYAGQISYHLPVGAGFYLEPSASLIYSRLAVADETTNVGALSFGKQQTAVGRLGLRAGADIAYADVTWSPYLLARYGREQRTGATFTIPQGPTFALTGLGDFAEFGLGLGANLPKLGLTAYIQGERQVGANVSGLVATGGLKFSF